MRVSYPSSIYEISGCSRSAGAELDGPENSLLLLVIRPRLEGSYCYGRCAYSENRFVARG
jgi:hypothetical protein